MSQTPLALGIDFGGTSIKMGLVRGDQVLAKGPVLDPQKAPSPDALIVELAEAVRGFAPQDGSLTAIGIGLPGLIDTAHGIVHVLSNVNGWREIPLVERLEAKLNLPVAIENDCNAMAYGEFLYGAGKGVPTVIALTLGTGVGAGIIIEGQLFRGASMSAGELGQTSIDWKGLHARYGNFGAVEKYVGNHQIAERAATAYSEAGQSLALNACTPAKLSELAMQGDSIANRIWMETGDMIGACLANAAWLINPNRFVIGGGIAQAGDLLFDPIRKSFDSRVSNIVANATEIVPASLGTEAGMIGCAALGLAKAAASTQ